MLPPFTFTAKVTRSRSPAFLLIGLFFAMSAFTSLANEPKWQEGKHYSVLNQHHANNRAGVVQLFSYWCLNCYRFEKMTLELQNKLPQTVKFSKVHVDYQPNIAANLQQLGTKYMLIARAVRKENDFNNAMFNAIHNQRKTLKNEQELQDILSAQGVDAGKVSKLASYAGMKSQINHNNKQFHGKTPTPAFIVNGKYLTKINRRMNQQELMDLIMWLTKQP